MRPLAYWQALEIKPDNITVICKYRILKDSLVVVLRMSSLQLVSLPHSKQEIPLTVSEKLNNEKKKTVQGYMGAIERLFCCLTFIKRCLPLLGSFPLGNHLLKLRKNSALEESQGEVRWHFILFPKCQPVVCTTASLKTLRLPS